MTTMNEKKDRPDYRCSAYLAMAPAWKRAGDVYGGVQSVRRGEYLTKFTRESPDDHKARKDATEFYNVTGRTIDAVVGTVCTMDIVPAEAPPALAEMFADIDLCGNDLASFLRDTFTNAVRDGHSFIFVDGPPPIERTEDGPPITGADVADRRPFWVNYKASQLINWQCDIKGGRLVFSQMTFEETTKEKDGGYGEKEVTRYRVLRPGSFSLYEKQEDKDELVIIHENVSTGRDTIPVAVVYGRRTAPLESVPPFLDLLETNIVHYNSQSVLREALKYVVPMPVFTLEKKEDAEDFKKLTMAANRSIVMWGQNVKAEYLELKGQSVEELRTDIATLEVRMAKLGIEKFAPTEQGTTKTATEVGSDNRKELSEISVMAANLENAVEQAFYFTAEVNNAIKGSSSPINLSETERSKLKLNIDYDKLTYSLDQLQFLNSLVDSGRLSLQSFLEMLPRVTSLPKGYDPETEVKRILDERSGSAAIDDLDARIDRALKLDGIVPHEEQLRIIYPEKSPEEIAAMAKTVSATEAVRQAEMFANG